jgi:hypothetical protein
MLGNSPLDEIVEEEILLTLMKRKKLPKLVGLFFIRAGRSVII